MQSALDYRENYGMQNYNPDKLSTGQMLMVAAAALAVGGTGFYFWAKRKEKAATAPASA